MAISWPNINSIQGLSPHQEEGLRSLLARGRLAVLAGGPGTGKTYCAAALIRAWIDQHGAESIAIAAPTGKAAVRITEAMIANGLTLRAKTIHSLLKVSDGGNGSVWKFEHCEGNPLPQRLIVCDESSMLDTSLACSLFAALEEDAHVLLVGDVHQLPPVGHGAPLRDIIAAGAPHCRLTEVRRNAGSIVRACHSIARGEKIVWDETLDWRAEEPRNLKLVQAATPQIQIDKMLAAIRLVEREGFDPIADIQVLAAVNAKSPLARKALNAILQTTLNPYGERAGRNPFAVGDKIVNLKNGFFPLKDKEDKVFVANGEIGRVTESYERRTIATLVGPDREIVIPQGAVKAPAADSDEAPAEEQTDTGCSWDLAYALSCHKSQGSEFPVVLIMLDTYPGARRICSREWLMTAVSRAKRICLGIGLGQTAADMINKLSLANRKTFLVEQIREECVR